MKLRIKTKDMRVESLRRTVARLRAQLREANATIAILQDEVIVWRGPKRTTRCYPKSND